MNRCLTIFTNLPKKILKSAKINGHLLLRDSKDPLVSSTQPALKAGRWSVGKTVQIAESEVRVKAMMGAPQFGKAVKSL